MSDLDRSIIYTYKIMTNADEVAEDVSEATEDATAKTEEFTRSTTEAEQASTKLNGAMQTQAIGLAQQVTLMMGLKSAVNSVSTSLIQMGIVEGEAAENLQTLNQGFNLLCGFATGLKAIAGIQEAIALSSLKEAIVKTYTSVLESPWKLALASAGMGAAAGVAIAYGQGSTAPTGGTTNIIIDSASGGTATTANKLNSVITGGRIA